jgi:hypothetical protein
LVHDRARAGSLFPDSPGGDYGLLASKRKANASIPPSGTFPNMRPMAAPKQMKAINTPMKPKAPWIKVQSGNQWRPQRQDDQQRAEAVLHGCIVSKRFS